MAKKTNNTRGNWISKHLLRKNVNFRIGYPYASASPENNKDTIVVLRQDNELGFNYVKKRNGAQYKIVNSDGREILNKCKRYGVVGEIIESDDERQSIAQGGCIHDAGDSMKLALVLSIFQKRYRENAPLLLFSGAVDYPPGNHPFINATIEPYCKTEHVKYSLIQKYHAAKMANARALIVLHEHAQILAEAEKQQVYELQNIHNQQDALMIIGVSQHDLPLLAEEIGINRCYFEKCTQKSMITKVFILCSIISFVIGLSIFVHLQKVNELKNFQNAVKEQVRVSDVVDSGLRTSKEHVTLQTTVFQIKKMSVQDYKSYIVLTLKIRLDGKFVFKHAEKSSIDIEICIERRQKGFTYSFIWGNFTNKLTYLQEDEILKIVEFCVRNWLKEVEKKCKEM